MEYSATPSLFLWNNGSGGKFSAEPVEADIPVLVDGETAVTISCRPASYTGKLT